jgi:hypothetical protein
MDNNKIHSTPPAALASYFVEQLHARSELDISQHLFDSVERQSISPTIFQVWLGISQSTATLLRALKQEFSISLRTAGIKRLAKLRRSRHWETTVVELGGTAGILELLAQFSVDHVKATVKVLGRATRRKDEEGRGKTISGLVTALAPVLYPDASGPKSDERPLGQYYALLLAGCDTEFVDEKFIPLTSEHEKCLTQTLLNAHRDVFQRYCMEEVEDGEFGVIEEYSLLFSTVSCGKGITQGLSESMEFSFDIVKRLVESSNKAYTDKDHLVSQKIIVPLVRRTWKRRHTIEQSIFEEIITQSVRCLKRYPGEPNSLFAEKSVLYYVVLAWSTVPKSRTPLAGLIAELFDLESSNYELNLFFYWINTVIAWVRRPMRYQLLRLAILHFAKPSYGKPVTDIDEDTDLERISVRWNSTLFLLLDQQSSLQLLQRLHQIKGDSFVESDTWSSSIFKASSGQTDISLMLIYLGERKGRL